MTKSLKLDIVRVDEPWATATLADGTEMKVKLVFTGAQRELDESGKPAFAPDGKPMITVKFNWVIDADVPEAAMQKVKTR
jgi:hypothetical protein